MCICIYIYIYIYRERESVCINIYYPKKLAALPLAKLPWRSGLGNQNPKVKAPKAKKNYLAEACRDSLHVGRMPSSSPGGLVLSLALGGCKGSINLLPCWGYIKK